MKWTMRRQQKNTRYFISRYINGYENINPMGWKVWLTREEKGRPRVKCPNWKTACGKQASSGRKAEGGTGDCILKKTRQNRKEAVLSQAQNETLYLAMQEIHDEQKCSISELCEFAGIPRSAYYKWLNRRVSANEKFNQELCSLIKDA